MKRLAPFSWATTALVLALSGGCERPPAPLSGDLVATFDGGEVTVEELARELFELPPPERPAGGALDDAWLENFAREIVVDRILDQQAELTGVETDPRLLAARAEFQRSEVWNAFVRNHLPVATPPTEEALRAEFEARRKALGPQVERRRASHIFVRRQPGESTSALRRRAGDLRSRHLNGEPFARLAETASDSESRVRGGSLGWVERSQLEPAVADILFSLEEGATSEPAVTRDGAHLFKVLSIQEPIDLEFEDVRDDLARDLSTREQEETVLELARSLPEPSEGFFVAGADELLALVEARDPTALVLRNGDYEVRLGALRDRAAGASSLSGILESLALRERVYVEAQREGWAASEEIQQRVERATEHERRRLQRLDGMRRFLGRDDSRLREYFEANKARFSTPLALDLERLEIPTDGNEKELVLALGDRLRQSPSTAVDLHQLARDFGGSVETLGWVAVDSIREPGLAGAIAGLQPGQSTLPRFLDGSVRLTAVRGRREPEVRSLASSLDAVRDAYLDEFGQTLYAEWRADLLQAAQAMVRVPRREEVLNVIAPPVEPAQADGG